MKQILLGAFLIIFANTQSDLSQRIDNNQLQRPNIACFKNSDCKRHDQKCQRNRCVNRPNICRNFCINGFKCVDSKCVRSIPNKACLKDCKNGEKCINRNCVKLDLNKCGN